MFPIGMAAMDQGYYGAAPAYWKAKELEQTQQAYDVLGQTFAQMSGQNQQQPTGWGPQAGPGMIPGGMPMPGAGGPPGAPPGAPGMMPPRPPMPPTTPQGPLAQIIPSPAAGAAAIPQAGGGMPPAQAPGPAVPGMPPNGAGPGQPPGGPGGPQPNIPGWGQPIPQPPPAITQALGPAPYDWRTIAATVAQANPGAPPAVIARAVTMMLPFMQQDSQNQWRQISAYLQEQRLDETRRSHEAGEAGRAAGREETERFHRQAEEDRQSRIRQGDRRMENTEAWRAQESARKDAMAAATLDKQDFDRKYNIWKQKYAVLDRNERARINAETNLTGAEKKEALARLDAQRGEAERDFEEFSKQLPEKREVPKQNIPKATPQQRVNEGFSGAGEGQPQPLPDPNSEANLKKLVESGQFTKDQVIQWLQQRNYVVPKWLTQ